MTQDDGLPYSFTKHDAETKLEMSIEQVTKILEDFEKQGLVFKTWDIKKQDYVWHKTEFGHEVAKEMNIE